MTADQGVVRTNFLPDSVDHQRALDRAIELTRIPGPTFHEERRAGYVEKWWREEGFADVHTDDAGNVWGRIGPAGDDALLICAHIDTVFSLDDPLQVITRGSRIYGPGIGDNGIAVSGMAVAGSMLAEVVTSPVWLVATTREEGLGGLAGIIYALDHAPGTIGAVIAMEGNYLGRVGVTGVASERYEIEVRAAGGHSWQHHSTPSAVHRAVTIASRFLEECKKLEPFHTVNIGSFQGGEGITRRAAHCAMRVDLRTDDPRGLSQVSSLLHSIAHQAAGDGVEIEIRQIGKREGGRIDGGDPLVVAAERALHQAGITPERIAISTDANAAYARHIPAISIGITYGDEQHTLEEWIEVEPVKLGIQALCTTVQDYLGGRTSALGGTRP